MQASLEEAFMEVTQDASQFHSVEDPAADLGAVEGTQA